MVGLSLRTQFGASDSQASHVSFSEPFLKILSGVPSFFSQQVSHLSLPPQNSPVATTATPFLGKLFLNVKLYVV